MNTYRKNAVMTGVLYRHGDGLWDFVLCRWRRSAFLDLNWQIYWASLPPIRPGLAGLHFLTS